MDVGDIHDLILMLVSFWEIFIVCQGSLLHIFGEIFPPSSGFCRLWTFLHAALCVIIISGFSEGIVSFNPRTNCKTYRGAGEDLRGYGTSGFVNYNNENVFTAHVPRYVTGHCFIWRCPGFVCLSFW